MSHPAHELNDESSARIRFYRPRFAETAPPDPEHGNLAGWEKLLGSREHESDAGPHGALTIVTSEENGRRTGYGTSSSSVIALASPERRPPPGAIWRFAAGPPDITPFNDVKL